MPWADLNAPLGSDVATGERQTVEGALDEAVQAARRVRGEGYDKVEATYIHEIIEESEDLTVEEIVEDIDLDDAEGNQGEEDETFSEIDPTTHQLTEILSQADEQTDLLNEFDGVPVKRKEASVETKNAFQEYQALFQSRVNDRHQVQITRFLQANRNNQPPPNAAVDQPSPPEVDNP